MESVDIVSRKAKNRYCWNGLRRLSEEVLISKTTALPRENRNIDDDAISPKAVSIIPHTSSKFDENAEGSYSSNSNNPCEGQILEPRPSRKDKSLGVLTLRFIGLFLNSGHGTVSLDAAAAQLVDGEAEPGKLKTITRRLYDIANVLCALSLIERATACGPCRKPSFRLCRQATASAHGTPGATAHDAAAPGSGPPPKRKGGLDGAEGGLCPKRCRPEQRLSALPDINSQG
jgi:hypothetical protein